MSIAPERSLAGAPPTGPDAARSRGAVRDAVLWSAFALAFSPLLLDLAGHVRERPWAAYGLLFAVALVALAWRTPACAPSRRDGYALLALALALQGLAVGGGFARWGRLALPLGVLGLARVLGRPAPRIAALAFWAVPLPTFVAAAASPWLELAWLHVAALVLSPIAPVALERTSALGPGGALTLGPTDGGLVLAALLSGLGWLRALGDWRGTAAAARTAARWGLVGLALQPLAVTFALALVIAGAPGAAQAFLSFGVLLLAGSIGLAVALRRRSRVE